MHYERWARPYREAGLPLPPREQKPPAPRPECSIDGCPSPAQGRGWCSKHYWRWQHYGDPEYLPERVKASCSVEDCDKSAVSLGMCVKHYTRQVRWGDPLAVRRIVGDDRARFESYVDRSGGRDSCHLWTGGQCHGGYAQVRIDGKLRMAHVAAWEIANDRAKPPDLDIDHECHNLAVRDGTCQPGQCPHRLCCNPAHLVAKTRQQHSQDTDMGIWEHPKGSAHGMAKLNEAQVQEIRRLLAARVMTQTRIASLYGVGPNVISRIKLGKIWDWLPPEP